MTQYCKKIFNKSIHLTREDPRGIDIRFITFYNLIGTRRKILGIRKIFMLRDVHKLDG